MIDYQGGVVFEWQKRTLAEQSNIATVNMEVGTPADGNIGPASVGLQSNIPNNPPNGHFGPTMRDRQGFYQSPHRSGGGGRGGPPPNFMSLPQRRPLGSGNTVGSIPTWSLGTISYIG